MTNQKILNEYVNEVKVWSEKILRSLVENKTDRDNSSLQLKVEHFLTHLQAVKRDIDVNVVRDIETQVTALDTEVRGYFSDRGIFAGGGVEIGEHTLPPLPYDYDALEPYISSEIMKLHHDKHHQSYVDGLNKAEEMMKKARETGDYDLLKHWEREAAFNGSGHYLHTIFWNVMKPKGGGKPSGKLLQQINNSFGSFEKFKNHFSEAAKKVEGVGWSILVWVPRAQRLEILQSERHQLMTQWDTIPLLVLDVWEHAYYLQYQNNRGEYVDNWWNVVNWGEVEQRFNESSKLTWKPY